MRPWQRAHVFLFRHHTHRAVKYSTSMVHNFPISTTGFFSHTCGNFTGTSGTDMLLYFVYTR